MVVTLATVVSLLVVTLVEVVSLTVVSLVTVVSLMVVTLVTVPVVSLTWSSAHFTEAAGSQLDLRVRVRVRVRFQSREQQDPTVAAQRTSLGWPRTPGVFGTWTDH